MALLKRKRVGLTDAMSVVTRFVNACNRHDADGVASCLHPDFDSIQPMYPSRNFRGADQVRRNWQAIFDAEPGFRLTVLRSAAMDDTVWLELHGAGRDAEVAGVFVMGIQGDRIRWARIYSALVEPVPAGVGEEAPPAPLHEVPRHDDQAPAADGEVIEEPLIAPVLDMDRSGRRRRRRRGGDEGAAEVAAPAAEAPAAEVTTTEAEAGTDVAPDAEAPDAETEVEAGADAGDQVEPEAVEVVEMVEMVEVEPEVVVVVEEEVDVAPAAEAVVAETETDTDDDIAWAEAGPAAADPLVVADEAETAIADDDDGPPTEAVEMESLTEAELDFESLPPPGPEPEPEPEPQAEAPAPEPPRRRFGRRLRP